MDKTYNLLTAELGIKPHIAEMTAAKFANHPDIKAELEEWIDTKVFPENSTVTGDRYNAAAIMRLAPHLHGVGAYNMLVTLRERPEVGRKIIAEGFRVL